MVVPNDAASRMSGLAFFEKNPDPKRRSRSYAEVGALTHPKKDLPIDASEETSHIQMHSIVPLT